MLQNGVFQSFPRFAAIAVNYVNIPVNYVNIQVFKWIFRLTM